ncbi:MAG: bifunctional phosphoribosyl-AMP cyclohydrolase/phosphoribosyl-ATP diphosphatase [Flavobacteriaceae bacterium]|mgnify:CR=1 FL=1|nr:bifunctional phosphoribosyl-AMP cyclohydrolase/phosphoribosyl-ATP diphosphatase [Flavobacteriaceae bacterium]|tara:strand:- start:902 stop:1501 length:600 start_codon:yes stop_codon:yes gene_type:complete
MKTPNFKKDPNGLLPTIVQDPKTLRVLMLGYMNAEALEKTQATRRVTFYSRSKGRLWTKGEESGNFLIYTTYKLDCDQDALLVYAQPKGPTCHTGADSCWEEENSSRFGFLSELEETIAQRKNADVDTSYVASLFKKGINKIAQKLGEEAVETVIEAKDENSELFLNESADLLFHYLILLQAKGFSLKDIETVLESRKR